MRKQLQKEFIDALRIAVDECGSQSELSRRSGVGQATINSILNDKNKREVLDSIMEKLYPFVKDHLAESVRINIYGGTAAGIVHGNMTTVSGQSESGIPSDVFALIMNSNMTATEKGECIRAILKK